MEQLTEPKQAPRRDPESITRLRNTNARRININVETVEAWLHALANEPWRGPDDVAANPPITPARAEAIGETFKALVKSAKQAQADAVAATGAPKPKLSEIELTNHELRELREAAEASQPELIKVSGAQLLADLADLGHFVFVSSDETADVDAVWADKLNYGDHIDGIGGDAQLSLAGMATASALDGIVVVDPKYSRRLCGRDLQRAVMRAVSFATDDDSIDAAYHPKERKARKAARLAEKRSVLQRWVLRRYWGLRPPLTFPTIAAVAKIAALGRIEELDEVASIGGEPNADTAALLVEAWDFLVVGVDDAVRAAQRICADAEGDVELDSVELDRAVLRLRSLHEGIATRLERELRGARASSDARRWRSTAAEFASRVAADPQRWNPEIGELNDAQILRLASSAGIVTTEPDHRIEGQVRTWLSDAGLGAEMATSLLWHGVSLTAAGHGEAFHAAIQRRADGDLGWADELNAICAAPAHAGR